MLEQTWLSDFLASTIMFEYGFYPVETGVYELWQLERTDFVLRFADFAGSTNILIKFKGPEIFP